MSAPNRLTKEKRAQLQRGVVIPAHPLALNAQRQFDERHQRALTRYYLAAGAGGIAVGVHTTQFSIRRPEVALLQPVWELAAETVREAGKVDTCLQVAGIVGPTKQAVQEAETAVHLGYDLGLVSMGGLDSWSDKALLERMNEIAEVIPVFAFYLQPAVGGRSLQYDFWRRVAEIEGVLAIKIAPFNRYETLAVVRAVCESGRRDEIALYTGNDDCIIGDLLTPYAFKDGVHSQEKRMVGGLLGQFAVWTRCAVLLHEKLRNCVLQDTDAKVGDWLRVGTSLTDANAALFDPSHAFRGCIAGIHEVLYRQGLLASTHCLDPSEVLSPGQKEEIDRVCAAYPELQDNAFVCEHLDAWLR